MQTRRHILYIIGIALIAAMSIPATAQRNDKVLNRPYSDLRRWHMGFSVGLFAPSLAFTHNGFVSEAGETWFVEQPSYSPGFCVNGLFDFRLNDYFSLRFTPGMYFGNRTVKMRDSNSGAIEQQDIKSTYIVMPLDIKYNALRLHNVRPYMLAGVMPTFDVAKRRNRDLLQLKPSDFMLSIGFGCDLYLPYFKFVPEIKFCFGLTDQLKRDRPDLDDDPDRLKFTQSLSKVRQQMVVLTFYFE
ncbi:porin family protein [uncultured Muribaculum sp.]|uniref:type IX secretion/gliding motility protein PorT/SprT n=1 Tax=uncultured Muribaculum sp. TaxID=1918613 RepID=UPI0025EDA0F7|nr:porin family protein [uncultured Muribaculum sp.]